MALNMCQIPSQMSFPKKKKPVTGAGFFFIPKNIGCNGNQIGQRKSCEKSVRFVVYTKIALGESPEGFAKALSPAVLSVI